MTTGSTTAATAATEAVLKEYYATITAGAAYDRDRLLAILAPDLVFEGPVAGHVVGAEPFSHGVAGFAETVRSVTTLQQLVVDGAAAVTYDGEMPGGTIRFSEFFEVADGRITTLRLLFDPAAYAAAGGR